MQLLYITTGCFRRYSSTLSCSLIWKHIAELYVADMFLGMLSAYVTMCSLEPGNTQVTHWIDPCMVIGGGGGQSGAKGLE